MALNERIGPSSRERLTTLAKSIGREEFAMNVLEIPSDKVLDDLADQLAELYDMRSLNEVTRYSGFLKNPPEPTPDSEPFNPTGAVAEFREDLRALFGKYKDELNNRKFIGGVAEVMVNWKSLLRSQMNEAFDELDDGFDQEMEDLIKAGPRLNKDRFEDVIYYIHNNWMAGNYGDDYAIRRISKYLNALEENVAPNHDGKAAPYGSGYDRVKKAVAESLRDWFKKEDWVRINTSGNIAGKCGTMKKGKPTTRCLPRKKAQSLTKAERKATVAKKVRGSKKGKQFVKNTDKAEFKKK